MMGRQNTGGGMTALLSLETGHDCKDDMLATVLSLSAELMQELVVVSLAYNDGMTPAKILQVNMIVQKRKTVQQAINVFQPQSL